MPSSLPATAPQLAESAAALAQWRSTRPRSTRIPEELWSQATELAERHGLAKVAVALKLDYKSLKRRLSVRHCADDARSARIIELRRTQSRPAAGASGFRPGSHRPSGPGAAHRTAAGDGQRSCRGRTYPLAGPTLLALNARLRVWVAAEPADFRCGIDGLARRVRQKLGEDPSSGGVFVFCNRRRTAVKLLVYDGQGFWLCQKRLSQGHYRFWPQEPPGKLLAPHALAVLLSGDDYAAAGGIPEWRAVA